MNFLNVLFLLFLRNLNEFPSFSKPNRQEILSMPTPNFEVHEKIRYDNFTVYGLKIENDRQRLLFKKLTSKRKNFDLWFNKDDNLHIMVNPKVSSQFREITRNEGLKAEILIPNVQSLIDEEVALKRRQKRQSFDWTRYHNLDEIFNWLNGTIVKHSRIAEHFLVGTSTEGRKIHGIKISHKTDNPGIFIESHIHAREWITSATATWIINELLTSKTSRVRYLAENFDWYIVPVLNVDGFVYSHEKDRLWRKTRSRRTINSNSDSDCVGVDANRNYNMHWMQNGGASSNPCDDVYAGPFPFSEPEARGLANYVHKMRHKINLMLAFHSYGQNLLSPFGYTTAEKPDNFADMMQVASAFTDTIANLSSHTQYQSGTTADKLYLASGCTTDWAYEEGILLSYTIEFRDQGQYGFLLPPDKIIPNSEETLAGLLALITEADNLGYMNLKKNSVPQGFDLLSFLRWRRH